MRQWDKYNIIMQALKNQLIAVVDNAYLQSIKDPITEYHSVSLLQVIEYLYDNYGKANKYQKNNNIEQMKEPFNVTTPIELFFQRIQECINFASTESKYLTPPFLLCSTPA